MYQSRSSPKQKLCSFVGAWLSSSIIEAFRSMPDWPIHSVCVCVCGMAASGAQQNLAENYFLSCVREWVRWIGISDAFVALHATHM